MDSGSTSLSGDTVAASISGGDGAIVLSADPARYYGNQQYIGFYRDTFKRAVDLLIGLVALILAFPIMVILGLIIVCIDGGPIFFVQDRVGLDLRPFKMFKFRTMRRDAEETLVSWKETNDPRWREYLENNFKISDDPRLLPFGRLLRRYSLDELPQIWNVVLGEMSMVGPRPLPILQHDEMDRDYEARALVLRSCVRPGITGLWQVSGRSSTTFQELLMHDLRYVESVSLWNDAVILSKTVRAVLSGNAAV
jgi:lipopolysaccharide/colanic/teichoic acid biosynthesis glycosyltransferase